MNERTVTRSRQSKRKRNADQASSRLLLDNQLDWCQPRYADAPVTPIDEDAVQAIHAASMTILENLGVLFLNDVALSFFESHGCRVEWDSKRVRMDRAWVME
jgi:trimethylamine--corrinoid protein Co-methyltransferase